MFTQCTVMRRALAASIVAASFAIGSLARADTYVFDKGHTEIRFAWSHFGVSKMSGMVMDYDGTLSFDAAAPEKSALEVTAKSGSLWTHVDKLTQHLKSPDFFDVAKHPEISFKTTKVEKTGEKSGRITGNFTLKGVTKPVTFNVKLVYQGPHPMSKKPTVGFSATTTIKRSEFNLGAYAPAISDDIELTVNTEMPQG